MYAFRGASLPSIKDAPFRTNLRIERFYRIHDFNLALSLNMHIKCPQLPT